MFTIVLEGGLVSSIISDDKNEIGMSIDILDYDVDGVDEEEVVNVIQDDGKKERAIVNQIEVEPSKIVYPSDNARLCEVFKSGEWRPILFPFIKKGDLVRLHDKVIEGQRTPETGDPFIVSSDAEFDYEINTWIVGVEEG